MNILMNALPTELIIGGRGYPIPTDYRTTIRFEQLLQRQKNPKRFFIQMMTLYFGENSALWPHDGAETVKQIVNFYSCGNPPKPPTEVRTAQGKERPINTMRERIYDFDIDAPYIYAAFRQTYGISLQQEPDMHWWEFSALFMGLPSSCRIVEIMGYRSTDLSKIKDTVRRSEMASLKAKWALPSMLSNEEKITNVGAILGRGLRQKGN